VYQLDYSYWVRSVDGMSCISTVEDGSAIPEGRARLGRAIVAMCR